MFRSATLEGGTEMWKIIIDGFPTKDEANSWMERNVKKQDWHLPRVEQEKEKTSDTEDGPSQRQER
jgi:hypothetical protein